MGLHGILQLAVVGVLILGILVAVVTLNRWDRGELPSQDADDGHAAPATPRRSGGSAAACVILGVGFMAVGLFLLLLPMLVTLADGYRITATLDVEAGRLVSLYLLTVGATFCMAGAIFLAAWLRPR